MTNKHGKKKRKKKLLPLRDEYPSCHNLDLIKPVVRGFSSESKTLFFGVSTPAAPSNKTGRFRLLLTERASCFCRLSKPAALTTGTDSRVSTEVRIAMRQSPA